MAAPKYFTTDLVSTNQVLAVGLAELGSRYGKEPLRRQLHFTGGTIIPFVTPHVV